MNFLKRAKQRRQHLAQDRQRRINLLIERGLIKDPSEIPDDAIPIDPTCSTKIGTWSPETFYRDVHFVCADCGTEECWSADSQQYYFEVIKASPYKAGKRCYPCRQARLADKEKRGREGQSE